MKPICCLLVLYCAATPFLTVETQASLADGLLAHYELNGNAQDSSGNGLHGTLGNVSFASDRFGVANKAASFNGTPTSYISINTHALDLAPAFTVSAWIKFPTEAGIDGPRIFSTAGYELTLNEHSVGRLAAMNYTLPAPLDAPTVESSSPVPSDSWIQIVGVWAANRMSLYINGSLSASLTTPVAPDYSRGWTPTIGVNSGAYSQSDYSGLIDDVRIYGRSLSDGEVQQLFQLESVPEPSVLVLAFTGLAFVLARRRN